MDVSPPALCVSSYPDLRSQQWPPSLYLDVGGVDFSQEDLLGLQAAQFTQQLLQARVLLVHVQPQAVAYRRGAVQFDDCKHSGPLNWPGLLGNSGLHLQGFCTQQPHL